MNKSDSLAVAVAVERKPLKCQPRRTSEPFVRGGRIFEQAINAMGWTKEMAADHYGVSASLMTRQATNQDNQHLSFQRICEMPKAFQREIAIRILRSVATKLRHSVEWDEEEVG